MSRTTIILVLALLAATAAPGAIHAQQRTQAGPIVESAMTAVLLLQDEGYRINPW